ERARWRSVQDHQRSPGHQAWRYPAQVFTGRIPAVLQRSAWRHERGGSPSAPGQRGARIQAKPSAPPRCDPRHYRLVAGTGPPGPFLRQHVSLDVRYIESWSILLDLKIILRTIGVVFSGTGS